MALPLVPLAIGAVAGAFVFNQVTGAAEDAGRAIEGAGGTLVQLAVLGGVGFLAFKFIERGGFK